MKILENSGENRLEFVKNYKSSRVTYDFYLAGKSRTSPCNIWRNWTKNEESLKFSQKKLKFFDLNLRNIDSMKKLGKYGIGKSHKSLISIRYTQNSLNLLENKQISKSLFAFLNALP